VTRLKRRVRAETRGPAESFEEKFAAFRGTRGSGSAVFPSRARSETRPRERHDARRTSASPGDGVSRPCHHDCARLEPVAARARATGTPCQAAHVDMLTHLAILFVYPRRLEPAFFVFS